ncbi:MAG TPA: hypothetical protein VFJ72_05645 [Rubrobacteraceae bacterium]|nr:hypothetical protein [Rubrobacteraceae bacterium]
MTIIRFKISRTRRSMTVFAAGLLVAIVLGLLLMTGPARAVPLPCDTCDPGGGTNTAPTVAANNATVTINESQTANNTGTYSDADGDPVTLSVTSGPGNVVPDAAGPGTWAWSYGTSDGPSQNATVTITASDGTDSSTVSFSLAVNNVAPNGSFRYPTSVDEGGPIGLSLTNPTDPSGVDTAAGFSYAFSCRDSLESGAGVFGNTFLFWTSHYGTLGSGNSANCPTDDNGSTTVRARIQDKDGGFTDSQPTTPSGCSLFSCPAGTTNPAYTGSVTINNVAPTATFNVSTTTVDEGSGGFTLSLTSPLDPSTADRNAGFSYAFDCGSGYGTFGSSSSASCPAGDGPATLAVGGKIKDKDGGVSEYANSVGVSNVAPQGNFNAPSSVNPDTQIPLSFTEPSDPSAADTNSGFSYAFDCGLGQGYTTSQSSSQAFCTAGDGNSQTVRGKIIDKDGGTTEYTRDVTINDITAPETTLDATGPSSITNSTSASFGFSSEANATFQCSLDGAALSACTSPKSYTSLPNGSHTFRVAATDAAGNTDATPAARSWTVDTIKPTITRMSPKPASTITDRTPTIKATIKDNVTNLQKSNIKLYVNGARISATKYSYSASTDVLTYNSPKLARGKKTVKVVATDAAGNVGARYWYFTIK